MAELREFCLDTLSHVILHHVKDEQEDKTELNQSENEITNTAEEKNTDVFAAFLSHYNWTHTNDNGNQQVLEWIVRNWKVFEIEGEKCLYPYLKYFLGFTFGEE